LDFDLAEIAGVLSPNRFDVCGPSPTATTIFQSHLHVDQVLTDNPQGARICLPMADRIRDPERGGITWLLEPQPLTSIQQIIDERIRTNFLALKLQPDNSVPRIPLRHSGTWSTAFLHGNIVFIGETDKSGLYSKDVEKYLDELPSGGYVVLPKSDPTNHGLHPRDLTEFINDEVKKRGLIPVGTTNIRMDNPVWRAITTKTVDGVGLSRGDERIPIRIPILPKQGISFQDAYGGKYSAREDRRYR